VHRALLHEDLGAASPHHHEPVAAVPGLERANVGDQLLGQIALVLALLDVGAVEPLHVALVEHGRHGLHGFQFTAYLFELRVLEHAGRPGRGVAVFLEDVPPAEHDVVEARQRCKLADLRRPALGALAEANRAHLGQRADRLGQALADGHHAGDGGGAHSPEAYEKQAQLALRGGDVYGLSHNRPLYHEEKWACSRSADLISTRSRSR
jgi:hypothetical protein